MLRAICSFLYVQPDGSQGFVRAGDQLVEDHPTVKGREALFAEVPGTVVVVEKKPSPRPKPTKAAQ